MGRPWEDAGDQSRPVDKPGRLPMTVFARKRGMLVVDWALLQDQLGKLVIAMGGPHNLMMFLAKSEEKPAVDDVYIGLPEATLLSSFPGFAEIQQSELPDYLSTLILREDGFRERFPDIAAKRRIRYGR
jgi:hypothetical protein